MVSTRCRFSVLVHRLCDTAARLKFTFSIALSIAQITLFGPVFGRHFRTAGVRQRTFLSVDWHHERLPSPGVAG